MLKLDDAELFNFFYSTINIGHCFAIKVNVWYNTRRKT